MSEMMLPLRSIWSGLFKKILSINVAEFLWTRGGLSTVGMRQQLCKDVIPDLAQIYWNGYICLRPAKLFEFLKDQMAILNEQHAALMMHSREHSAKFLTLREASLLEIFSAQLKNPSGKFPCIVSVFMVVSFQDLFENKSTKNLQSQIKEMQRRFKSEIVTENDCCITLTFVDSVCCLIN